jgi:nitric oxide reductase large subunit
LGANPETTGARIRADPKFLQRHQSVENLVVEALWVSLLIKILFVCLFILFSVVVLEEKTQGEIWEKVIDWQSVLWKFFFWRGALSEFVLKSPYQNNLP